MQVCLTEVGRLVVVSKYGAAMPPHADEVILRGGLIDVTVTRDEAEVLRGGSSTHPSARAARTKVPGQSGAVIDFRRWRPPPTGE